MTKVEQFKKRIDDQMNMLQRMMEAQVHIDDPDTVKEIIDRCSLYWSFLDDGDRDYIHCASDALEEKQPWNIDDE